MQFNNNVTSSGVKTNNMTPTPFNRSYWVASNKLLAGEIPAARTAEETEEKLKALADCGISVILNLMEADETDSSNQPFYEYSLHLEQLGMQMIRLPIEDLSIPTVAEMNEILATIDRCNADGKAVYVHCWGGIGRTGTVVGCYLIDAQLATTEDVFTKIDELRSSTSTIDRPSPETIEQIKFVEQWKIN